MRQMAVNERFGFANHLALNMLFISYEKWMPREKYPNNTCHSKQVDVLCWYTWMKAQQQK